MIMFYEKYSEKVFVDCMIDCIMKSKNIEEPEAVDLYNKLTSSLTIDDSVCVIDGGASIRHGIINILDKNGIVLSELTRKMYLKNEITRLLETYSEEEIMREVKYLYKTELEF